MSEIKHKLNVPHAKDLDQMSSNELRAEPEQLKIEKMGIETANRQSGLHNPKAGGGSKQNRKTIARIMTILVKRGEPCVIRK